MTGFVKGLRLTGIAIIGIAVILWAVANREMMGISFFPIPYDIAMPKFLFILFCVMLGVVLGGLLLGMRNMQLSSTIKQQQQRINALEGEISAVRAERAHLLPEVPKLPNLK